MVGHPQRARCRRRTEVAAGQDNVSTGDTFHRYFVQAGVVQYQTKYLVTLSSYCMFAHTACMQQLAKQLTLKGHVESLTQREYPGTMNKQFVYLHGGYA